MFYCGLYRGELFYLPSSPSTVNSFELELLSVQGKTVRMGSTNTPPTAGRGSEQPCDNILERDILQRGHYTELTTAQWTDTEPDIQLADGDKLESRGAVEDTNRKSRAISGAPTPPKSYNSTEFLTFLICDFLALASYGGYSDFVNLQRRAQHYSYHSARGSVGAP